MTKTDHRQPLPRTETEPVAVLPPAVVEARSTQQTGRVSSSAVPGARSTRQRAAVAELLAGVEEFRSAQDVHASLLARGDRIGLTTVYRTLASMAEAGLVDVLRTDDGEAVYRRCSQSHHHHLVCRGCGRTVEVDGPAVERWADTVAAEHGFIDVSHTVEVFGTCSACAGRR